MKRVFLLIATNLAVMVVVSILASGLGVNRWLTANGLHDGQLLVFCALFGFGGAFVSLLISKPVAKWTTGAQVIDGSENANARWLVSTVERLASTAGIQMPEVAIYDGEPNAFATGATRNSALVAVSTGLLQTMGPREVEAVLAHEVAHVANGDMVTMTLVQGVLNTFVMFLARVIGYAVDKLISRDENEGPGLAYSIIVVVLDLAFGVLASIVAAAYSRHREFRADAGAAELMGSPIPMIQALRALSQQESHELPGGLKAFGIAGRLSLSSVFASHPPLEARIAALQTR